MHNRTVCVYSGGDGSEPERGYLGDNQNGTEVGATEQESWSLFHDS